MAICGSEKGREGVRLEKASERQKASLATDIEVLVWLGGVLAGP